MSRCLLLCRLCLAASSFLVGNLLTNTESVRIHAAEDPAEGQQPSSTVFRRLFVPADSPETWPVGSERFLPLSSAEFSRLVREAQNQTAKQRQLPVYVSKAVYRAELLAGDSLQGTAEWTVELPGKQPRLLPLAPLNLAIESMHWLSDPTQPASVGLWKREESSAELAVLAQEPDTLMMQWQLAPNITDAARLDYDLEKPIIVPQTLELLLPENRSARLSSAELLRTDPGPPGKTRWVFQLAPRERHRLRIVRLDVTPTHGVLPLVSQTTSYQLDSSGLKVITQLRLDAREAQITELKATIVNGLRMVDVRVDQQPVDWRIDQDGGESLLVIPRPESQHPQSVEIHSLAKSRSDIPWSLPRLEFDEVAWTEGTTSLLVSPDLILRSLTPRHASLQHIVGIASDTRKGEVFRLQEWSSDAEIEIEVGRPDPKLSTRILTTVELGHDEAQASIVATLSSSSGQIYQVQAEVAPGWSIDSVTATPKSALNEWQMNREGNSAKLYLQLNQPIPEQQPLRIKVEARETTGQPVLPATARQLKLLRFLETNTHQELLQLQTRKLKQLALPERIERARLTPNEITSELSQEFSELTTESNSGALIDLSLLDEAEVIEFRQHPAQYQAKLQIEIDALPDSLKQQYKIACSLRSGTVSELVFRFDEPLPDTLQWNLIGHQGFVAMERIEAKVNDPSQNGTAQYMLRLPTPMTDDFRLQATYSQPAQPTERCNLVRLPQSVDWSGQILIRGALDRFRILDQGWTPTIATAYPAEDNQLPVLGTYRWGPAEIRRGSANAGLQLQRQFEDLPVPRLMAWLAEYQTLQAANGAAIHTASYSLENVGTGEAEIILPAGAELQEAWLGTEPLEAQQVSSQGNSYQIRFNGEQRWPYLTLKYSTRESPLAGSSSLRPVVPECSFPVNLNRWTLWAPEQYEIDNTQQSYSSQRYHWWKRVFGPLARSRGETVFRPLQGASWTTLWSAPLVGQQTKQTADTLATQLVNRLETNPNQSLGELLSDLTDSSQATESFCIDRLALLAKGIQSHTTSNELVTFDRTTRFLGAQALPLSSYRLALLVSQGTIVFTTAERVAHWHDQLRPTEESGVFLVSSDDLADRLDKIRSSDSREVVSVADWLSSPLVDSPHWSSPDSMMLADVGLRAQTVEFVEGLPTLVVRRAYVQQGLWYALVLLTLVLGVWQLAHYPNVMIFVAAMAAAACLIVPPHWLTVPQAVFLGLVAAAIVRIALKASQFGEDRSSASRQVAQTTAMIFILGFPAQSQTALAQTTVVAEKTAVTEQSLPRVLVPIDSQGRQQGEDVYLSEGFLKKLQRAPRPGQSDGAQLVILAASYSGSLPNEAKKVGAEYSPSLTDPWTLRWKVESYQPNCRLHLPLQRDEALWIETSHRLDGVPVKLDWQSDGKGCSVVLPETGVHWLQLVARPRFTTVDRSALLRLQVPPLPGATLDLALAPNVDKLQISGVGKITKNDTLDRWQCLLEGKNAIELRWSPKAANKAVTSWEELEQLAWLRVEPAAVRLDVQLSVTGYRAASPLVELKVSTHLKLETPGVDSPILEVMHPSPSQPTRLQLKLRPDLPSDFVIPLRFEIQREVSVGRIFFPRVRLVGSPPIQNLFAVSVSAGLTQNEQVSSDLRSIEPAEFSELWNTSTEEPLYAYALGQEDPDWSLSVWPDLQSFAVQQTLRVHCLPNQAQVDFEAVVEQLTGSWLSHRIQVPESLQIDSITIQDQVEMNTVAVRWSRVHATEAVVFLGRPLNNAHLLKVQGHINATTDNEIELPQVRLINGERGEIHLDLYRTEEVQVSWTDPQRAPQEIEEQSIPRSSEEIHVGHYSWRSSQASELSRIRLERNHQKFETATVTTVDLGLAAWTACLNSHVQVQQGVLSRLSLAAPANFRMPYILQPEQIGVIDKVVESTGGTEITLLLTQPATAGDEVEIRLSGTLSLPPDQRLVVPSLQWNGATKRERYVLLPTLVDQQSIEWQTSGLRRRPLPQRLSPFAPEREAVLSYRLEQSQFEAKERAFHSTMRNAVVRYAKVSGILDAEGQLTATAELVLQPGRASSCAIQLPPESHLSQLIVGDVPVRRELRDDGSWILPLGPPFMPQRIIVNYRSRPQRSGGRVRLTPPKLLLGDQALPSPQTWWRIRTTTGVQLSEPEVGRLSNEIQFTKNSYRQPLVVLEDALSQALDLPREEGRAWAQTWQSVVRQAERDWQVFDPGGNENLEFSTAEKAQLGFVEAFANEGETPTSRQTSLIYPPRLPKSPEASPVQNEHFFVSDSRGQLLLTTSQGLRRNLWRWFAATALVCGAIAVVLQLRRKPNWHHELCHWPHSLALGGGFAWWLLLKPSAIGMLVILLAAISLAIKGWRSHRRQRQFKPSTQLAAPAS